MDEAHEEALIRSNRLLASYALHALTCVSAESASKVLDDFAYAFTDSLDVDPLLLRDHDRIEFHSFGRGTCAGKAIEIARARSITIEDEVESELRFSALYAVLLADKKIAPRMVAAARAQRRARAIVVELLAACGIPTS